MYSYTCVENAMSHWGSRKQNRDGYPMYLHVALIIGIIYNWRLYIDYLGVKLGKIVRLAT